MKLLFCKLLESIMYSFELRMLLKEKLGSDLGELLYEFVQETPQPHVWPIDEPGPSPWDPLICVDAAATGLPLFAP